MTPASPVERAVSTSPLGLSSVLAGSLPPALGTAEAPDRYTVAAVFTRRPERAEIERIVGDDTRDALTAAGYSTIQLTVSDRRLEIANTNLEELRSGLATWIADRLVAITSGMLEARAAAAAARLRSSADESERAAAVALLAQTVSFAPSTLRA